MSMTTVADQLERVLAATGVLDPHEVPLADAFGRRVADPVHALVPIPLWRNSAMDGYAVRHDDVAHAGTDPVTLRVVEDLPAGVAGCRDRALILTSFALGLRASDACGLDLADAAPAIDGCAFLSSPALTTKNETTATAMARNT